MQYRKRRYDKQQIHKNRAIDVLYEKMEFYNGKARGIFTEIVELLKQNDVAQGKRLVEMSKMMMRFNDIVIECASKLAPYQSAKLQSIEVKKTVENRFVIQAPALIRNKEDWLQQVQLTQIPAPVPQFKRVEPITETKSINYGTNNSEIIDIEPDYEIDNTLQERDYNGVAK